MGIPEDDPRNPAVIADLVGDNVGDCAGRGSDLFQTFSDDIITGMLMGVLFISKFGPNGVIFPFMLEAVGVLSSMFGISIVRRWKRISANRLTGPRSYRNSNSQRLRLVLSVHIFP